MANKYSRDASAGFSKSLTSVFSNYSIRAKRLKVIGRDGNFLGEMSFKDAISLSQSLDLDLIQVSGGEIPTCKIGDLSKFLYERKKRDKEKQRQMKDSAIGLKQVVIHTTIDSGDLARKLNEVQKFLNERNNVKLTLQMRGREMNLKDEAFRIVRSCVEKLSSVAKAETGPKLNGRSIEVLFVKK